MSLFKETFSSPKVYDTIEKKLFDITLLLTICVFFIWAVIAVLASYTAIITITYWGGLFVYSGLFIAYRRGGSFTLLTGIYYILSFALLGLVWLPAGGITGAIMQMSILVFVSGLLVLPLRIYILYVVLITIVVAGYSIFEYNVPDAATPYTDPVGQIRDIGIASVILFLVLGLAFYRFKRAYEEDRDNLNEAMGELGKEKERAEQADRAKTRFLTTISHEMRTPLNGIIGLSELLGGTQLNTEQDEMLRNLTYSSTILHGLISDVLDLTLIEDGKLVLHENEINIREEVSKVLETFYPRLKDKARKVELTYEHDEGIPIVVWNDVTRFRQILVNLVNNAVKFTRVGYIRVTSRVNTVSESEVVLSFEVKDTGIGIAKEKQPELFTKFYKANEDSQIEGTGLGLSICKRLVETMGGEISFSSEEKAGSVFRFTLPFRVQESLSNTEDSNLENSGKYDDLHILVAEDFKINQLVLTKMLDNLGIENVDVVENGKRAVEKSRALHYDVILMDISMPELDGIEATKMILEESTELNKKPPIIIAITANAMNTDLEACMKAGMSDFISKPFTAKMLEDAFSKYV